MHPVLITADEPFLPLSTWMAEAEANEPEVYNAAQLATVCAQGRPHVRTVLIKAYGADGLVFYTNVHSQKGLDVRANPYVAVVLHFKSLQRQILAEGPVEQVPDHVADAYWPQRPRGSQIAAWGSRQSQPIEPPNTLQQQVSETEQRFGDGPIPRPPFWTGFSIQPEQIEFWQGRPHRLHDRVRFQRDSDGWKREQLYP